MLRQTRRAALVLPMLLAARGASAEPGAGTLDDPLLVDAFPYVAADTTVGAASEIIDAYSCAPGTDETGPERIYGFALAAPARVTAWVEGDGGSVDIDVHLLDDGALDGGVATSCAARGNTIAEAEMSAGEHLVVVDSYAGAAQAGPYVLHLEAIGDDWIERAVADGVQWRARRFVDLDGPQVVHELSVDTTVPDVEIRAIAASGCQTVAAVGAAAGAIAGVNGGYFGLGGGCPPVSLLKASGSLVGTNDVDRGAFGLTSVGAPMVEMVAADQDWPAAHEAHGGGPILVVDAVAYQGADDWAAQGFSSSGFNGDNPRTFAGIDAAGLSHLGTVDGRGASAAGMSLDELAAFTASDELGLVDVVNLDGGGSTTMWIDGATPNGVVNYPSDAPQDDDPEHPGSRPCSGGFFVFAPPYNHPPRFQTTPVIDAVAGSDYQYDADAIDLDVEDVVSFSLELGPADMSIDEASGVVTYAPSVESPPSVEVTVRASDDRGAFTDQAYTLDIEGGMGTGGQGGQGGGAAEGGTGGQLGAIAGDDDGGCGCRLGARPVGRPWWVLIGVLGWARVRRRAARACKQRSAT